MTDFINRRLRIFFEFYRHYHKYPSYVKWQEVLRVLFEPALKRRALRYIKEIMPDINKEYLVIKLISCNKPLYWPAQFSMRDLYQVIAEIFNKDDWHYYEIDETLVKKGDVVVDCGASEGAFSLKNYEKAQFIYIIEPVIIFTDALKKTFNNVKNIEIINCALTDDISKTVLMDQNSIFSSLKASTGKKTKSATIDELFYNKGIEIDFIKMDVEGAEESVLRGAAETIRRYKPKMAIAAYHDTNDWHEMVRFVKDVCPKYNYKIKGIYHINLKPVLIHFWI